MEETSYDMPWVVPGMTSSGQMQQGEAPVFIGTLRSFYGQQGRWPTNFSEITDYAQSMRLWAPPKSYEKAVFTTGDDGGLTVVSDKGRLSLSGGGPVLGRPRLPANVPRPPYSPSMPNFGGSGLAGPPVQEETRTLSFVVRNFRAELLRWPTNFAELSDYAKHHLQPEIPERYSDATFMTNTEGGLEITYKNGKMTIGGGGKK
jgi:hypothetical protein